MNNFNGSLPAMPSPIATGDEGTIYNILEQSGGVLGGLTKREHFAAMAMQGYISAGSTGMPDAGEIAALAAECADAMLSALEK